MERKFDARGWLKETNTETNESKNKRLQTIWFNGRKIGEQIWNWERRASKSVNEYKNDDSPTFKLVSRSEKCRCCPLLLKTRIWDNVLIERGFVTVVSDLSGCLNVETFSRIAIKLSEMKQWIRMMWASSLPRETDPTSNSSSKRIASTRDKMELRQEDCYKTVSSLLFFLLCSVSPCSVVLHKRIFRAKELPPPLCLHGNETITIRRNLCGESAAIQRRLTLLYSPPDIQLSVETEVSEPKHEEYCTSWKIVEQGGKCQHRHGSQIEEIQTWMGWVKLIERKTSKPTTKFKGRNKTKLLTASPFHWTTTEMNTITIEVLCGCQNWKWTNFGLGFEVASFRNEKFGNIQMPFKQASWRESNHSMEEKGNKTKQSNISQKYKSNTLSQSSQIETKNNNNNNNNNRSRRSQQMTEQKYWPPLNINNEKKTITREMCGCQNWKSTNLMLMDFKVRSEMRSLATFQISIGHKRWRGVQPFYGRKETKQRKQICQTNKHQTPCHLKNWKSNRSKM